MNNYIIESFRSNVTDTLFILQDDSLTYTNSRNGFTYHKDDFLCSGGVKINSVKLLSDNEIFSLSDQVLLLGSSSIRRINHISTRSGEVIFSLSDGSLAFTNSNSVSKYEKPVKQPVTSSSRFKVVKKTSDSAKSQNIFEEIETQIKSKWQDIRLRINKKRRETPKEFLIRFFTEWNNSSGENPKDTIFVNNPEEVQTSAGKRRSLGDLYMLLKYYYPDVTLAEVIKLLYVTLPAEIPLKVCICRQINKRVWISYNGSNSDIRHAEEEDEYGNTEEFYINQLKNN